MSTKIKLLYLLLAILLAYTLWPGDTDDVAKAPSWDIQVDAAGNLKVLGVELGVNTLKEAEVILQSRSQRALFIPPEKDGKPQPTVIEAFFSNMPDNSKLLLGLTTQSQDLELIQHKAHNPMAFPSGNIKLEIADEHQPLLEAMVVNTLTSIPRIRITPAQIESQFGKPQLVHSQDEVLHFLYPDIGLDAILDESGEAIIQFVNPKDFQRVLDGLGLSQEAITTKADS